jgi:ATP-dependent protease HslVU (ClpYQ) ATPase subunit
MIRDLTEIAVEMTRAEKIEEIAEKAELNAEERLLDLLLPTRPAAPNYFNFDAEEERGPAAPDAQAGDGGDDQAHGTREKLRAQLRSGKLDNRLVEMEVREKSFPTIEVAGPQGIESKAPASSSSTRLTRSPDGRRARGRTSRARASKETSSPSSRARPSTRATAWCARIISSSSPPGPSTSPSPRT